MTDAPERFDVDAARLQRLGFRLCVCSHLLTAHVLPGGDCRSCPATDPCDGFEPVDPVSGSSTRDEESA